MRLSLDHLTSDLHIGHVNMRTWRGMLDTHTMDENNDEIIDRFNDRVRPNDTVGIWGDAVMGKMDDTLPLVKRLHGRKILLPGNHDRPWLGNRKRITETHNWPDRYAEVGFEFILPGVYTIDGIPGEVKCDHFPYSGDHTAEERYPEWRPDDEGHWLIHGHVHDLWKQNGKQINVGADAWGGFPTNPDEIAALMAAGPNYIPANAEWGFGKRPTELDNVT